MIPVRQSTAFETAIGPVLDANGAAVTDCVVGDFKLKKTTGNFAALNGSATLTHVSAGMYDLVLTTSDVDTVGLACIAIDDTTNACSPLYLQVVEEAVYDMLFASSALGYIANAPVNVAQISGDSTAADNAESFFDGTGYAGTNNVIPTVTTLTNAPSDSSGVTTLLSRIGGAITISGGRVDANVTYFGGSAGTFSSGRPEVNATHWGGTAVASALVRGNLIQVNGSATPVTNFATVFDTDFANNYNTTLDTWNVNTTTLSGQNVSSSATVDFDVLTSGATAATAYLDATISSRSTVTTAQVNAEVDTALADIRLDELLAADSDIDGAAPPTVGSVFHELMTKTTGSFTYDQTTDSLEALRDNAGTNGAAYVFASGALANITAWTVAITGNITGNLSGSVGSVTGNVGGNVTGSVGSISGITFPTNFGSMVISAGGVVSADVVAVSSDTTAADNLESYLDGTNFMPVDAHKPVFSISGATLTVKRPDAVTTAYTKTLTTDASAVPIIGAS